MNFTMPELSAPPSAAAVRISRRKPRNARIGVFGVGYHVYWSQFPGLREELLSSARSIEEMSIAPAARNIEVTKYLVVWGGSQLDTRD